MSATEARCALALLLTAWCGPVAANITCSASSVSLNLGAYTVTDPLAADSSTVFTVTCTRNGGRRDAEVTVAIGPSLHTGATATRALKLVTGADLLSYNVFRDAAMQQVWGDTPGVNTVSQNVTVPNRSSVTLTFTMFARLPPLQDVRAGAYADQLTVTVLP